MRNRLVLLLVPVATVGAIAVPSHAEPKKVEKSYTATAPVADIAALCDGTLPSIHEEPFTAPAAGKLVAKLSGYPIDWDLFVRTPEGNELASSTTFNEAESVVSLKLKKGAKIVIVACNTGGGPTAAGSYVFTY